MKSLGKRWRTWKYFLKQQHYNTHETEEEQLADRNPRVLKEQWQFLVAYWSTEKAKVLLAVIHLCVAELDLQFLGLLYYFNIFSLISSQVLAVKLLSQTWSLVILQEQRALQG